MTKLVAEKVDKNSMASEEISGERVWKEAGFFGELRTDYNMEKVNFPDINQTYLTIQKNKKIYYCDYFILGQIIEACNPPNEACNPPNDISKYELEDGEVQFFRPTHIKDTGEFLGLYETTGFLVVRGYAEEIFLSYGYDIEKSKVFY